MYFKSSWLLSRVPFTIVMLPLFWIVLLVSPNINEWRSLWVLFIVHVLLYAASNGYVNSYRRKFSARSDVNVSGRSLYISLGLHVVAIVSGFFLVNITFAIVVLFYGLTAHAYGIASTQWKTPYVPAWLVVRGIQGGVATILYYIGLNNFDWDSVWNIKVWIPAAVSTIILVAAFPAQRHDYRNESASKVSGSPLSELLLVSAAYAIMLWFFNAYISSQYNVGIAISLVVVLAVIFLKSTLKSNIGTIRHLTLQDWLLTLILNGHAFYLFTDHTHVLQLLQL